MCVGKNNIIRKGRSFKKTNSLSSRTKLSAHELEPNDDLLIYVKNERSKDVMAETEKGSGSCHFMFAHCRIHNDISEFILSVLRDCVECLFAIISTVAV